MFVLNPDPYLLPSYRISPFSTSDITFNNNLPVSNLIDDYFKDRFGGHEYHYTLNGREAINHALSYYHLQKDDTVTILTTSGNSYISRCVTTEVEKFCRWSRYIDSSTRLVLVNHEFGYPFQGLAELKKKGIPVVEDCAHSFFSLDMGNNTGKLGDFTIYSFPKMFPIQLGGLLVQNLAVGIDYPSTPNDGFIRYMKNAMSYYIDFYESLIAKRIENYKILRDLFNELGFSERFVLEDGIVPGVFMFNAGEINIDLDELKRHFWAQGIQCSVFYGENSFFIPVHQRLTSDDAEYFYEVMKLFLNSKSA